MHKHTPLLQETQKRDFFCMVDACYAYTVEENPKQHKRCSLPKQLLAQDSVILSMAMIADQVFPGLHVPRLAQLPQRIRAAPVPGRLEAGAGLTLEAVHEALWRKLRPTLAGVRKVTCAKTVSHKVNATI